MSTCPICARGEPENILVKLGATWVTGALQAPLPGYVCVVSKMHVAEPDELIGEDRRAIWDEVSIVAEAVQVATGARKINYEIHGNTIEHLHLYPRFDGDPFAGRPIDGASREYERSIAELEALKAAIVSAMSS